MRLSNIWIVPIVLLALTRCGPGPERGGEGPPCLYAGRDVARVRRRARRTARSRAIQGDDQGADPVRRSPAGHGSQPRGGRLDRGAAQELRLRAPSGSPTSISPPDGPRRRAPRSQPGRERSAARGRRRPAARHSHADRRRTPIRTRSPTRAARAQHAADRCRARARRSTARRSAPPIPTRCTSSAPTWTARLGRSGQRRWLGHGAGDGAGAHLQQPDVRDRALDPLRAVEQRGDRAQRRARLCRAARRRCRARRSRPDRAAIPSRNGSA